ncbi:unnamed protein product [Cyclocybe aegerita]|uniref:F-box domain-containing protein n=1 Tax=Cyclocybe aegerita TaxID=1973307 RepID=A0A8S0WMU7_CYCAE|nr:unnamed protein product [Cyclocybe aegerita]
MEPPIETIRLLLGVASRWRSFTLLNSDSLQVLSQELASGILHFDNLQHIDIQGRKDAELLWTFRHAPRLETVEFDGFIRPQMLDIDWSTVHQIYSVLEISDCWTIVCKASSLKRLRFEMLRLINRPAGTQPIYCLAHLTQVDLSCDEGGIAGTFDLFFGQVTLPALRSLTVETCSENGQWLPSLTKMFLRSRSPLEKLSINSAGYPPENEILSLLRELPGLQYFILRTNIYENPRFIFSDILAQFLTLPRQRESVEHLIHQRLPSLKSFSYIGNIEFKTDTFISMLRSRIEPSLYQPQNTLQVLESIQITYHNKSWAQEQDPNVMQRFYVDLAGFGASGTKVDFVWERHRRD